MPSLPALAQVLPTTKREISDLTQSVGIATAPAQTLESMRGQLMAQLSGQVGVERLLQTLSPETLRLAVDMAWHGGGVLYGNRIEPPGDRSLVPRDVRARAEELRAKGLLFSLGSRDYYARHPGYTMAHESAPWIAAAGAMRLGGKETPLHLHADRGSGIALGCEWLHDLVRLLGEMRRKPAGITQQGTLYRRDVDRLQKLLTPRRPAMLSPAWDRLAKELFDFAPQFGPWREDAPPEAGFLLWMALGLGLARVADGAVRPAKNWQRKLERAGPAEVWRRALSAVVSLHMYEQSALYWYVLLSAQNWLSVPHLLQVTLLSEVGLFDEEVPIGPASLLRSLAQIGALEVAMIDGAPAVRLTTLGAALRTGVLPLPPFSEHWTVLPSGDILVPPDLAPSVLARLEDVARPAKVDAISTYRMSPETLQAAIEGGLRYEQIATMLEDHALGDVPQPVRFRLEEWLGRSGRYRFVEAALLVCRSAQDAQAALSLKSVRERVIEVLGETCLVIPAADEEQLRAALAREGLVPERDVQRPSGLYSEDALKEMRKPQRTLRLLLWGRGEIIEPL